MPIPPLFPKNKKKEIWKRKGVGLATRYRSLTAAAAAADSRWRYVTRYVAKYRPKIEFFFFFFFLKAFVVVLLVITTTIAVVVPQGIACTAELVCGYKWRG